MVRELFLTACVVSKTMTARAHGFDQTRPVPLLVNGVYGDGAFDRSGLLSHPFTSQSHYYIGFRTDINSGFGSQMKSLFIRKYIESVGADLNYRHLQSIHDNNDLHIMV